jgi:hypothetical protein
MSPFTVAEAGPGWKRSVDPSPAVCNKYHLKPLSKYLLASIFSQKRKRAIACKPPLKPAISDNAISPKSHHIHSLTRRSLLYEVQQIFMIDYDAALLALFCLLCEQSKPNLHVFSQGCKSSRFWSDQNIRKWLKVVDRPPTMCNKPFFPLTWIFFIILLVFEDIVRH